MIVSTPNPHSFKKISYNLLKTEPTTDADEKKTSPDLHVGYYFPDDFKRLAKRYGFKETQRFWLLGDWRDISTLKGKLGLFLFSWLPKRIRANNWLGVYEKVE